VGDVRFRTGPVRIRVPATSANLGPGFDALGLALGVYDDLEVGVAPSGLTVEVDGEGADAVPRDGTNLVVRTLRATLDDLGGQPPGLSLRCTNRIPHGRGLGSSAAAIVAGVMAAYALVADARAEVDDAAVIARGSAYEGHPDNVAACVLGGLTIAWTPTDAPVRAIRLEPASLTPVLFVPEGSLATETARAVLPGVVPHADAAVNAGRAALLVAALAAGRHAGAEADLDLLLAATEDRLHQRYRAPAMPASAALVADLRARGVPAVVSGAGPTVLAFAQAGTGGRLAGTAPEGFRAYEVPLDPHGAQILP
jgi:homoserine kinase